MIDIQEAKHVEVQIDSTGKLWINVDEKCQLRIGQVATLQLRFDDNQYISKGKDGIFIQKRHTTENCWCGKSHVPHKQVRQARPHVAPKD